MSNRTVPSRRSLLQAAAALSGSLLILRAALPGAHRAALAQEPEAEDTSGHGRGRGRGRGGNDDGDHADDASGQAADVAALAAQIPPGAIEIRIVSDDAGGFVPGDLTVDLGQTVAFINTHRDEHTATGSGFDTGIIREGSVATVVLEEPGTFRYACQIHPEMTGQIAVRDASGVVPAPATPAASPVAGGVTVRIANLAFDPATITVPVGSTVTWSNDDVTPHTVTAVTGEFDSGIFDPGASFAWTFPEPGAFAYQCLLHPTMQGSVVVEDGAAAAGSPAPASNDTVTTATDDPGSEGSAAIWLVDLIPEERTALAPQRALISLQADGAARADFAVIGAVTDAGMRLSGGHGTWREADGQLTLALVALLTDADGRLGGTVVIHATGQRSGDDRALAGDWTFAITDSSGGSVGEGQGTWQGTPAPLEQ